MDMKGLKQVDILNLTIPFCEQYNVKFNKSDISQYVSGKTEPNQDKLFILSEALDVDVTWLMGYDVPMEKRKPKPTDIEFDLWKEKYNPDGASADQVKIEELIRKLYGDDCIDAFILYNQLDSSDKGEIRGEMKHMLKADKYSVKKESKNA